MTCLLYLHFTEDFRALSPRNNPNRKEADMLTIHDEREKAES